MNANVMTAVEIAKYSVTDSLDRTARFGELPESTPRAAMIGRNDQRAVGGRDAVLSACRALPGLLGEHARADGYVEFHGVSAHDFTVRVWRVVVI